MYSRWKGMLQWYTLEGVELLRNTRDMVIIVKKYIDFFVPSQESLPFQIRT